MIKSAKYANVYAEGYLTLWPAGKNSTPPLVPFPQHNMRFGAYIYLAKQLPHSGLKSKKCCHVFREATLFASKPNINVGFFRIFSNRVAPKGPAE